jgi:hypothetical protein
MRIIFTSQKNHPSFWQNFGDLNVKTLNLYKLFYDLLEADSVPKP